ncbi:MAG: gamma-glutamyltransferase 1 [Verrucomicrobiaceae bacterium]|nr:gamma-glutamyltransferase 1 [Verrucomicrobiaceae bacterium]
MKAWIWAVSLVLAVCCQALAEVVGYKHGAVASVHPLATQAGVDALKRGGNAVDAAIATALTLGVVDGHNSGIGGGCFILIRAADGSITCIDGRETAPAKAHRDLFVIQGKLDDEASKTGALASGVPGALAAYDEALKRHGKLKLAELLLPAAAIAEKGFPIDEVYARKLAGMVDKLKRFPASAAVLLKPDGSPWEKGHVLVQKDLAATYRAVAEHGTGWFYHGDFAQAVSAWMAGNGGIMTVEDFASYTPKLREPLRTRYRGYEIIGMPPPSSGGIHVAQILGMMEGFPIKELPVVQRVHVITEAMKLAFADRAFWLGDPDFVPVPKGLIDPGYLAGLKDRIDPTKATLVPAHGMPPKPHDDVFGKHTTHFSTADAEGNWVAMTQTINTAFGSKVIIPGTGVIMNDEMDDFSVQPGAPNAFKLVGAEANAVAAGKRPLSSMSPTIVLRDGKPVITVGSAGGPTIITQTLLAISNIVDFGMQPAEALAAPRFHHQWAPDSLKIESAFGEDTLKQVEAMGHSLERVTTFGACQCIMFDAETGNFLPAHDPRIPGSADGL